MTAGQAPKPTDRAAYSVFFRNRAVTSPIANAAKTAVSERSKSQPVQSFRGLHGRDAGRSQVIACYWLPNHCAILRKPELLEDVKTPGWRSQVLLQVQVKGMA